MEWIERKGTPRLQFNIINFNKNKKTFTVFLQVLLTLQLIGIQLLQFANNLMLENKKETNKFKGFSSFFIVSVEEELFA